MKEIRIHGRGGQGNVVAAEMLAGAAFADGWQVQAFPAFGAERTGAPVQAFVRLSDQPIRRRSQVYEPDVVIVQDPTLIHITDVLAGLQTDGLVLVNAETVPQELLQHTGEAIMAIPASDIAREVIGREITNTTLLGAYAAATGDLSFDALSQAIHLRLGDRLADKNVEAARRGFAFVRANQPVHGRRNGAREARALASFRPTARTSMMEPGTSREYLTGGWRTNRPSFLYQRCNGCLLCVVYCPEGIVREESKNHFVADFDFCKGCGICAEECPVNDIEMVAE